jgi:4-hydroxybenzoate polyprenyltransferase
MRLANIVTAISDILAGVAIAAYAVNLNWNEIELRPVLLLILSTIGLYGGGVVFNDVFDADLDRVERPERPIPSGLISKDAATGLGVILLLVGVISAAFVHTENLLSLSLLLAIAISVAALVYDKWGKHQPVLGPVNMGLCRGLNLLLGMSIIPAVVYQYWILALVPIVYIAAITMISRGEVHGGNRRTLYAAVGLYILVIVSIGMYALENRAIGYSSIFLLVLAVLIFPPLIRAIKDPRGRQIGKAVKAGVISLIIMNAAWAAAFGSIPLAVIIFWLLPISLWLAKMFAVT